jgi:O-glycosyl hydrolase
MLSKVSLWVTLIVPALLSGPSGLSEVVVTVDGSQTYQTMEGFGVNANHRGWNNNELKPVLDALIDQAGMTLFRVIFDKTDWEDTNDNSNPNVFNWTYYNQVYSTPDFQKMWDMAAYLNQRGITDGLMFNLQGNGPDWMGGSALTDGYEAEWAEMVASLFMYARNTQHLQFNLVAPNNEPDQPLMGVGMTIPQYVTALHTLAGLLDTNGLSDLRFVGPDDGFTITDWLSAMMDDPVVMGKLAHFGLHSYSDGGGVSGGVYNFLQQSPYPDRSFWMTEYNAWCASCENGQGGDDSWEFARDSMRYLLYHLANGASAALIWEGYDSQYHYYAPGQWSYWGLFAVDDINAVSKTYTPRKLFYALSQISRFVRPGARALDVTPWATSPYVQAFYHADGGQLTVTGMNPDANTETLSGTLTNLPPVASLELYYTDRMTNLCHSATIPVTDGMFTAEIPPDCVFTLVNFDPTWNPVSVIITNPPDGAFFTAPATIPVEASATTTTGSISLVEFFCGVDNLSDALYPPYSITWNDVPPGHYVLTAAAYDSVGNSRISPSVHVTVVGPAAQISVTPTNALVVPYGTQQFTATVLDELGSALILQPAVFWSVSDGGYVDADGLFTAGGSVGGPFTISAGVTGLTGAASISIATNLNLAPVGLGRTWYSLTASTDNSPEALAPGINDGDLATDVPLLPSGLEEPHIAYEAAGVIWPTAQTINQVIYYNGSYNFWNDGVFADEFGLQFSPDGVTWRDADPAWTVTPPYVYNSGASADTSFTFTGGVATVRGVRCIGRVHTANTRRNSWVAFATEVQAYAAPVQPVGPDITVQPTNQTVFVGAPATFSTAASGTVPLSYQWLFNGTNLDGAVAATLSLTNVQPEQAGSYSVVVTNIVGAETSAVAMLTAVAAPPAILLDPTNQTVAAGTTVEFSVAASGTPPLVYQWQFNGANLEGAVADTFTLTNAQPEHAGGYGVVVSNAVGSATSAVATLTVLVLPPVITLDPTNQTVLVGATVTFSVAANGTPPLSYQWQFNGTNLEGAVAATLNLTNVQPEQAGAYTAEVANAGGTTNSATAILTVLHYPVLLDARMATNGAFAFTLSGDAGCCYMVEVSTNLSEWTPLSTLSNATGQADFTDSASPNSKSRFYRARLAE